MQTKENGVHQALARWKEVARAGGGEEKDTRVSELGAPNQAKAGAVELQKRHSATKKASCAAQALRRQKGGRKEASRGSEKKKSLWLRQGGGGKDKGEPLSSSKGGRFLSRDAARRAEARGLDSI